MHEEGRGLRRGEERRGKDRTGQDRAEAKLELKRWSLEVETAGAEVED